MATRTDPVRLRDLYSAATMHAFASAVSFMAIVAFRHAVTLNAIYALALLLCLSYAVTALALALIPSGRAALRESLSIVTVIASRT
jgi:hypothetical protein